MFDEYLHSLQDRHTKYISYATDLVSYIQTSIADELPFYATHSHCTDGGVAGSMIRYAIPEAAIIPMDYWMINDPNFSPILEVIPWKGIVDLKPFNKDVIDFWVDHHISARNSLPNANRIRFDINGDSGSYQLLLSDFLDAMPEHMIELAVMTRITDTAGYSTEPPTTQIEDLTALDYSSPEHEKLDYENRVWLLDDAWGSTYSLKEHLDLHNILAKEGYRALSRVLGKVNNLREKRNNAYIISDKIPITDVVAFVFDEDTQDKFTILRRLQKNGAKVVISLSRTQEGTYKISFRRNRFLSEEENQIIQVHLIAEKMEGGGHAGAAGAFSENLEFASKKISDWSKNLNLDYHLEHL